MPLDQALRDETDWAHRDTQDYFEGPTGSHASTLERTSSYSAANDCFSRRQRLDGNDFYAVAPRRVLAVSESLENVDQNQWASRRCAQCI
jgi:hypothetical protein